MRGGSGVEERAKLSGGVNTCSHVGFCSRTVDLSSPLLIRLTAAAIRRADVCFAAVDWSWRGKCTLVHDHKVTKRREGQKKENRSLLTFLQLMDGEIIRLLRSEHKWSFRSNHHGCWRSGWCDVPGRRHFLCFAKRDPGKKGKKRGIKHNYKNEQPVLSFRYKDVLQPHNHTMCFVPRTRSDLHLNSAPTLCLFSGCSFTLSELRSVPLEVSSSPSWILTTVLSSYLKLRWLLGMRRVSPLLLKLSYTVASAKTHSVQGLWH